MSRERDLGALFNRRGAAMPRNPVRNQQSFHVWLASLWRCGKVSMHAGFFLFLAVLLFPRRLFAHRCSFYAEQRVPGRTAGALTSRLFLCGTFPGNKLDLPHSSARTACSRALRCCRDGVQGGRESQFREERVKVEGDEAAAPLISRL